MNRKNEITNIDVDQFHLRELSNTNNLLLFDLAIEGHHPNYIQYLIEFWCQQRRGGNLYAIVSPEFFKIHGDITQLDQINENANFKFVHITEEEEYTWKNEKNVILKIWREWQLFCKYSRNLHATRSLLMYFDHFQLPLALGLKSPCPLSGIYFRPTFHYDEFSEYTSSWQDRLRQWRQKWLLSRVLQHSQLEVLFSLDPFVVKYIEKLADRTKILPLADPIEVAQFEPSEIEHFQQQLGVDEGRKALLLFGRIDSRKGIYQLLEAIDCLKSETCQQMCLLLVGKIPDSEKSSIKQQIEKISQLQPIQIILHNEFISDREVHLYFQVADLVLAPYQRHVGMSGILLLAAAAGKPVLASDYGLMGEITRKYELGYTVDSSNSQLIAQGIDYCLQKSPEKLCDRQKMDLFIRQNDAEKFSQTIFGVFK